MAAFVASEPAEPAKAGSPGEPGWLKSVLPAACPSEADAAELKASINETMGGCILDLYRSATSNIHADWSVMSAHMVWPMRASG
ncbi:hypothetical protein [Streptomyces sp. GESEQ-35]|uniref:hypothetical protein n=1 Tax=Streptomyces sp. GESEQ-35 TaxID=2812657 RepID=UPI001B3233F4|nr:hypothetical protein [Streptomyces sp. GESEQ-35]